MFGTQASNSLYFLLETKTLRRTGRDSASQPLVCLADGRAVVDRLATSCRWFLEPLKHPGLSTRAVQARFSLEISMQWTLTINMKDDNQGLEAESSNAPKETQQERVMKRTAYHPSRSDVPCRKRKEKHAISRVQGFIASVLPVAEGHGIFCTTSKYGKRVLVMVGGTQTATSKPQYAINSITGSIRICVSFP